MPICVTLHSLPFKFHTESIEIVISPSIHISITASPLIIDTYRPCLGVFQRENHESDAAKAAILRKDGALDTEMRINPVNERKNASATPS